MPAVASPKPLPVPDDLSAGYWAAAARGVLALPRCQVCRRYAFPPRNVCPECATGDPAYVTEPVDGGGTVRSWTVVRDAFLPGFTGDVPYVLVDVELDAQTDLRMIGRLADGPDAPLRVGAHVAVIFDRLDDEFAVPAFVLREHRGAGIPRSSERGPSGPARSAESGEDIS